MTIFWDKHRFSRTCQTGQCCMTILKDTAKTTPQKHRRNNTTTKTPTQQHHPPTQPPKHNHNTATKTPPQHHHLKKHHLHHLQNTTSKTPTVLLRTTKYCILLQFWAPSPHEVTKGSLGDMKSLHFTTVLSVQHARSDERVATRRRKIGVLPQFLSVRHARNDERVATRSHKIGVLPQFWASDTSRSDERVAARREKFAFYHSFERPTRPKWRKGRAAKWEICVFTTVLSVRHVRSDERVARLGKKFAFYLSFERPTRTKWREGCQIHRCDPCAPDRKRIYFNTFSDDFD